MCTHGNSEDNMNYCNKTTIYIPAKLSGCTAVTIPSDRITAAVGGVTFEDVRGAYTMPDGSTAYDHIIKYSWWHKLNEPTIAYIATIARALIDLGETAVLVEYQRTARRDGNIGTVISARIMTAEDVKESDDE